MPHLRMLAGLSGSSCGARPRSPRGSTPRWGGDLDPATRGMPCTVLLARRDEPALQPRGGTADQRTGPHPRPAHRRVRRGAPKRAEPGSDSSNPEPPEVSGCSSTATASSVRGGSAGPVEATLVVPRMWCRGVPAGVLRGRRAAGCDLAPVDTSSAEGGDYLTSFVWPWQRERHARLTAALTVARSTGSSSTAGPRPRSGWPSGSPSRCLTPPWCGTPSPGCTGLPRRPPPWTTRFGWRDGGCRSPTSRSSTTGQRPGSGSPSGFPRVRR